MSYGFKSRLSHHLHHSAQARVQLQSNWLKVIRLLCFQRCSGSFTPQDSRQRGAACHIFGVAMQHNLAFLHHQRAV